MTKFRLFKRLTPSPTRYGLIDKYNVAEYCAEKSLIPIRKNKFTCGDLWLFGEGFGKEVGVGFDLLGGEYRYIRCGRGWKGLAGNCEST